MATLDWLLLAILGVSALTGLMRGFIGVVASVAAWLLGGCAAFALGGGVARAVSDRVQPSPTELFLGYGICFVAAALLVALAGWMARRLLRAAGLDGVDRALGLAAGGLRGVVMACAVVLLLGFTPLPRQRDWHASTLVPVFRPGAAWIATWLPHWARQRLDLDGTGAEREMPTLPKIPALPA